MFLEPTQIVVPCTSKLVLVNVNISDSLNSVKSTSSNLAYPAVANWKESVPVSVVKVAVDLYSIGVIDKSAGKL